ncbi:MAG: WD40 repeat domain-containing protein [Pleurocapsa minor GSE-CHR-MK-17-07R]|jgi:WD40 repeat protein|nr:WD40 repeat domain-containing protein [Pleurocapsa minor GSE-CHR-MK 17-07R]
MRRLLIVVLVSLFVGSGVNGQETLNLTQPIPGSVQRLTTPEISWNAVTNLLAYMPEQPARDTGANAQSDTGGYIALWRPELNLVGNTIALNSTDVEQLPVMQGSTQAAASLQSTLPHFLEFDPTGTLLATIGRAGLVMYDIDEAIPLFSPQRILGVSWSPDGTRLISQSLEAPYTAQIWDARTGNLLSTYPLFPTPSDLRFEQLDFSWGTPDQVAINGYSSGNIRAILDLSTGQVRDILNCCPSGPPRLLWQPGGHLLAMRDAIYDLDTQSILFTFPAQADIYWSPDGQFLVGKILDQVSIISVAERRIITQFTVAALGERHVVSDVEWSPDLRYLALATTNREQNNTVSYYLSLWSLEAMGTSGTAD